MKQVSFRTDVLPLKNKLYRLALRITLNPQEAEDIVQDTLIKVWNKRERWNEIDSIEAFSLTICRNLAIDSTRKNGNRFYSLDDMATVPKEQTANPYENMLHKDGMALVKRLMDNLPEKQKSCLQLRDIEGLSYKEIAEVLAITEDQVKVNIFRARQAIKQQFQAYNEYGL